MIAVQTASLIVMSFSYHDVEIAPALSHLWPNMIFVNNFLVLFNVGNVLYLIRD